MILSHNIESFHSVGLSVQKAIYIQNMAEFFKLTDISEDRWHIMSDTKIIQALTNIKRCGK